MLLKQILLYQVVIIVFKVKSKNLQQYGTVGIQFLVLSSMQYLNVLTE